MTAFGNRFDQLQWSILGMDLSRFRLHATLPSAVRASRVLQARRRHFPSLLGLNQPMERLVEGCRDAAKNPLVRGFMVGRTSWGEPCRDWLAGTFPDHDSYAGWAAAMPARVKASVLVRKRGG